MATPFFRSGVAVLVFCGEELALFERQGYYCSYQTVQGGIEEGETPAQAAQRELAEEIGIAGYEPLPLNLLTVYKFPQLSTPDRVERFKGCAGQVHEWFYVELPPQPEFTLGSEFAEVGYFSPRFDTFEELVPRFKREQLRTALWQALIQREMKGYAQERTANQKGTPPEGK